MAVSSHEKVIAHSDGEHWYWALVDRNGRVARSAHDDQDMPEWVDAQPVTVLVDASRCVGLKVELPEIPAPRLAQALRWAAEEHLAGSAEEEHVVAGPRADDGRLCCVVIGESVMRELNRPLVDNPPERMVPDALCLPWQPGQISLAGVGGRILLRWDEWSFGSFDSELAEEMIEGVAPESAEWVWYGGERPDWLEQRNPRDGAGGHDWAAVLAQGAEESGVNLLSGPWSPRSAVAARSHWRWAGGLVVAAIVLFVSSVAMERHQLARQADELQSAIEARFNDAFPDVGRVVRPREQAERELARLRFGQAAGLLDLMNRTAPVIDGKQQVSLDGLNYRDGMLDLTVRAPDVATLDEIEQRLRALDLSADVQSASLDEEGASGRIRITEAGQ